MKMYAASRRIFRNIFRIPYFEGAILGVIAVIIIWGYYSILDDFFIMDDIDIIREFSSFNAFLKHLRCGMGGDFYRPLVSLLFFWDFSWWEWNPLGYHITNLFFHIANALLVYGLTKRLTGRVMAGTAAGILFGLHTCHTEAVTWISGRMDVLCTTFFLLSVYTFAELRASQSHPPQKNTILQRILSLLPLTFFACALLTKEMAVTLPFILVVFSAIFPAQTKLSPRETAKISIPYFLLLVGYFVIRLVLFHGLGGYDSKLLGTFLFKNLEMYFRFLAIPFGDVIFSSSLPINLVGIVVITGACLLLSKATRFAMLWLYITVLPVLAFAIGRGAYLPSAGFCMAAGTILTFSMRNISIFRERRKFRAAIHVIQGVVIGVICYQYAVALRVSNEWWSDVARINEQVPLMVKTIYPTFPEKANICLEGVPLIFNQRFQTAFQLRYQDVELGRIQVEPLEAYAEEMDREDVDETYFFHYDPQEETMYDVTYQLRDTVRYQPGMTMVRLEQHPQHVLSAKNPHVSLQFEEDARFAAVGIVTSLANGIDVPQGYVVARGSVRSEAGHIEEFEIAAGRDTSEWAIRFPGIQSQSQHKMTGVYRAWTVKQAEKNFAVAQNYITVMNFQIPLILEEFFLEFVSEENAPENLMLDVNRIVLYPDRNS
jgi:hypothetical protein